MGAVAAVALQSWLVKEVSSDGHHTNKTSNDCNTGNRLVVAICSTLSSVALKKMGCEIRGIWAQGLCFSQERRLGLDWERLVEV